MILTKFATQARALKRQSRSGSSYLKFQENAYRVPCTHDTEGSMYLNQGPLEFP